MLQKIKTWLVVRRAMKPKASFLPNRLLKEGSIISTKENK
jgi:hypothetical protein